MISPTTELASRAGGLCWATLALVGCNSLVDSFYLSRFPDDRDQCGSIIGDLVVLHDEDNPEHGPRVEQASRCGDATLVDCHVAASGRQFCVTTSAQIVERALGGTSCTQVHEGTSPLLVEPRNELFFVATWGGESWLASIMLESGHEAYALHSYLGPGGGRLLQVGDGRILVPAPDGALALIDLDALTISRYEAPPCEPLAFLPRTSEVVCGIPPALREGFDLALGAQVKGEPPPPWSTKYYAIHLEAGTSCWLRSPHWMEIRAYDPTRDMLRVRWGSHAWPFGPELRYWNREDDTCYVAKRLRDDTDDALLMPKPLSSTDGTAR